MTNALSAPDMDTSSDGSVIYVSCHTGNGTGTSVSEQYAFEIVDNQMEPYYVDINDIADCPGDRIAISYDAGKNAAAIFADDEKILTNDLTSIGTAGSESAAPDSFYCGDQISYTLDGDSVKVLFLPVLSPQAQPEVRFYLENSPFLKADLLFNYNKNGMITSFDLGKVVSNRQAVYRSNE